jgi:hypothetical protein
MSFRWILKQECKLSEKARNDKGTRKEAPSDIQNTVGAYNQETWARPQHAQEDGAGTALKTNLLKQAQESPHVRGPTEE